LWESYFFEKSPFAQNENAGSLTISERLSEKQNWFCRRFGRKAFGKGKMFLYLAVSYRL
jgi:hypothetical protein